MGFRLTNDMPNVDTAAARHRPYGHNRGDVNRAKKVFDTIVAIIALIVLSPLILVAVLMIRLQDGGPVLFAQDRIGKDGRMFRCFKLRTMVPDAQAQLDILIAESPKARREWEYNQKLTDDPRITPLGSFFRKTSIDELPQLWNIIMGDMSLVGPRPIIESEVVRYGDKFQDYCSVLPGLTGLWQVRGRSDTTYDERVELDATYARTRSFWGDVLILLQTVPVVLFVRGAR